MIGVKVQWYELIKSTDVFTGRYGGAFLHKTNEKKSKTWTDTVSTDSVMVAFDSLTKKGTLPASVQKHLRRELTTLR